MTVSKKFFDTSTRKLARELLGTFLRHKSPDGITVGRIVETEAYLFRADPACHAHRGKTKRNAPMFGPAGLAYVYFIYGMHYCFNVVSGKRDEGEAVLIRALEPTEGVLLMQSRRGRKDIRTLCNGPAKLVEAMGITPDLNGSCLRTGPVSILSRESFGPQFGRVPRDGIISTTRIGIKDGRDLLLRFYLKDNDFVSRK